MTPFYETWEYFVITSLIYWGGRAVDMLVSQHTDWYYGLDEAHAFGKSWSRGKDGQFDLKKNLIVSIVWYAISLPIGYASGSWGAATSLSLAGGVGSYGVALGNWMLAKKRRRQQIAILQSIRANPGADFDAGTFVGRNGKSFYKLFQWLYVVSSGDLGADSGRAARVLSNLAVNIPEADWFNPKYNAKVLAPDLA